MDWGAIAGFTSIGLLIICNMIVVAYSYGKVKQKVDGLCQRVGRLEDAVYDNAKKEKS